MPPNYEVRGNLRFTVYIYFIFKPNKPLRTKLHIYFYFVGYFCGELCLDPPSSWDAFLENSNVDPTSEHDCNMPFLWILLLNIWGDVLYPHMISSQRTIEKFPSWEFAIFFSRTQWLWPKLAFTKALYFKVSSVTLVHFEIWPVSPFTRTKRAHF